MITWDEIVLVLAKDLQTGDELTELLPSINSEMKSRLISFMSKMLHRENPDFECNSDKKKLESILKTLMARKLVKMKPSYYGSWSVPQWQFTPRGFQYLSELQAIRSIS